MRSINELKHIICQRKNIKWLFLLEILVIAVYGAVVLASYTPQELTFGEDDMQLKQDTDLVDGNYMDTSFENVKAVVTPAFRLSKGIYYIEASYARRGIVWAGLLYDEPRNRRELVDDHEFYLSPDKQSISYRVKIHDDSALRFKMRQSAEAVDGDYIQLFQVRIVSSRRTCVYRIFQVLLFLILADLLLLGYIRYYTKLREIGREGGEREIVFTILAITAFFLSLPLFQSGLQASNDLKFHLSRLEGIYQAFTAGDIQFPVRIQPGWLDGYGYAASVFYGDILLYVPALLRVVGFTLEESYKVYMGGVNIATVFLAFYAFRKMTRNDTAAMIGSVLYAGSMHRMSLLYGSTLGEVSGMMFYPLIVAGFYLLFTEDIESEEYDRIWILLTAGFTGILMTHMLSCLMIGLYSVLLCVVMLKRLLRKKTFLTLFRAAGMTVLLNLWFLVPFLQYMFTEKLRINFALSQEEKNVTDYYAALADFTQEGRSIYELFAGDKQIGFAILIAILLFVLLLPFQEKGRQSRQMKIFSVFALFTLVVGLDIFPVVPLARRSRLLLKLFGTLQSQDRFLSVAIVMIVGLAVLFFATKVFDRRKLWQIAAILCSITLYQNLQYFDSLSCDQIYLDMIDLEQRGDRDIYSYTVGNGEYLPITTQTTALTDAIESGEQVRVEQTERSGLSFVVDVESTSAQAEQILFPVLYYGGYRAKDTAGRETLAVESGDNGRVAVTVPPGYEGTFSLRYQEPLLWRFAEAVSLMTLAVMLAVSYHKRSMEKRMPRIAEKGAENGDQKSDRSVIS